MHTIEIVVGDWSNDGHGMTEQFTIQSSHTASEIETAYKAGTKKIGVNFINKYCQDYEDSYVSRKAAQRFLDAGISFDGAELYDPEDPDSKFCFNPDGFCSVYLQIVKLGNPAIEIKMRKGEQITIGGYGLFRH